MLAKRIGINALLVIGVMLGSVASARGQLLTGDWVDDTQRAIETHRMTDLHVILLDEAGQYVPNAQVHVQMERHAFTWGVHLPHEAFTEDGEALKWDGDAPVWRCFNAVALDAATAWPVMEPQLGEHADQTLKAMIDWCASHGLTMRFGGVLSADPDHLPTWLGQLDDPSLRAAVEGHVTRVLRQYGDTMRQFDLYPHLVDHQFIEARLGLPMVRHLHELAHAVRPEAKIGFRFENCLVSGRLQQMLAKVTELNEAFVPGDVLVLDDEVTGTVLPAPLLRAMVWLRGTELPVVMGRLEVSGGSATAAAVNLEMLLRVLFAEPAVEGIFLSGVTPEQVKSANAALVDEEGQLTGAGEVFDGLVRKLWWTDEKAKTDALGNVRMRVFAGTYRINAELSDGRQVTMRVHVPKDDRPRLVVLQPIGPRG